MNAGSREPVLSHRLGRFLRWFFNASPEAVVELSPARLSARRSATFSHRQPLPRVVARHRGPVPVAVKGKS